MGKRGKWGNERGYLVGVYPCLPWLFTLCFRIDFRMFLCSLSGSIFLLLIILVHYSFSLFLFIHFILLLSCNLVTLL